MVDVFSAFDCFSHNYDFAKNLLLAAGGVVPDLVTFPAAQL